MENEMIDKVTNPKATILRLWKYLKKDQKKIIWVIIMVIISTFASVIAPILVSRIIDNNIMPLCFDGMVTMLIILAILYVVTSGFNLFTSRMMIRISENALYKLRRELFNKLQNLSLNFFDKNKKGDIMSRFTNDVTEISNALSDAFVQVISSVITLVGVIIVMFILNPLLAITTIITVPFFFILVMKVGTKIGKLYKKRQNVLGKLTSYSEEMISGVEVIKSFGKEDKAVKEFEKHNNDLKDISIRASIYSSLMMPINMAIANLSNILLISVGAVLTINNLATIGSILAFLTYSNMFRRPINMLASIFASIQSALAGTERIFEVLDTEIDVKDSEYAKPLQYVEGNVKFNNVNFGYDEKLILKNFNLSVKAGENIAIVGPTGAGKTTIINLIPRFYNVNSGSIEIDGQNINDVKLSDLRKSIGLVLQDTYLFKGTVIENIRYSKTDATDDEVIEATKKAQAHSFIRRLPNGYYSEVEEGGSNFSQGERQLMSIARAVLANHEILILDEATSSVDTRTEMEIQKGMSELMKGKTSFVIAHRLSTIVNANRIIVLNDGKIVEEGSHLDLLKKEGVYYKLYNSQFE